MPTTAPGAPRPPVRDPAWVHPPQPRPRTPVPPLPGAPPPQPRAPGARGLLLEQAPWAGSAPQGPRAPQLRTALGEAAAPRQRPCFLERTLTAGPRQRLCGGGPRECPHPSRAPGAAVPTTSSSHACTPAALPPQLASHTRFAGGVRKCAASMAPSPHPGSQTPGSWCGVPDQGHGRPAQSDPHWPLQLGGQSPGHCPSSVWLSWCQSPQDPGLCF